MLKRNRLDSPQASDNEDGPACEGLPGCEQGGAASTSSDASPSSSSGHYLLANDTPATEKPEPMLTKQRASNGETVTIVTWNCQHAAPETINKDKLWLTLERLREELASKPDALALQETVFPEGRLAWAKGRTPGYSWHCSPKAPRVISETVQFPGRGNWLLIRKGGPLDGGATVHAGGFDDQHRVVALRTPRHGLLVAYYGPACCGDEAKKRGDYTRYFRGVSDFLARHRDQLLAVVGDLNMVFDPFDLTNRHKVPRHQVSDDAYQRMQTNKEMLRNAGLVDLWRLQHPDAREYSRQDEEFSDTMHERGVRGAHRGMSGRWARVDHVLVPQRLVADATATIHTSILPHEKPRSSDHIPVSVRFEFEFGRK